MSESRSEISIDTSSTGTGSTSSRKTKEKNFFQKIRSFRHNKNDPSSSSKPKSKLSPVGRLRRNGRFGKKKKNSLDSLSLGSNTHTTNCDGDGTNPLVHVTIPEDSVLPPRRVIKAARPIKNQPYSVTYMSPTSLVHSADQGNLKSMFPVSDHETVDTNSTSSVNEKIQNRGGSNSVLSSVQDENLREKTEQWRKERLDVSAAIRKENKEKEVMEHRRTSSSKKEHGRGNFSNVPDEIEVSAIFKTRTFHPEHKRKVDEDNHRHDSEKKLKIDEHVEEEEKTSGDEKKKGKSMRLSLDMPTWITTATVAAAACAISIVVIRAMRKR